MCAYSCFVCCESFHVCASLWELNVLFYAAWPWCNIANIVVRGDLHKKTIQSGLGSCKSAILFHSLMAFSANALL